MAAIRRDDITGLVLAGGRGSRMGGVDKGLQLHRGVPLALHAIRRLAPQVGGLVVNANRHADRYAAFGVPVCHDAAPDDDDGRTPSDMPVDAPAYAGPLAGFLAGLRHCTTPYLATVPCDAPNFPLDLVGRLAEALAAQGGEIAMASTATASGEQPVVAIADSFAGHRSGAAAVFAGPCDNRRPQPVFCLMRTTVADSLLRFVQRGGRQVGRWAGERRCVDVPFADEAAFVNVNTLDELARLQAIA